MRDGGFIYAFDPLPDDFESMLLTRHGVVLATPLNWRKGTSGASSIRNLAKEPFVTFQRTVNPTYYDQLIKACSRDGLTLRFAQEVGSEGEMLSLVSAGQIGRASGRERGWQCV